MSRQNKKVVKYRKPINHNIGTIIFGIMFIYIIINVIIFTTKDRLATYEVTQDIMMKTINSTGIILRNEELVNCTTSGYMNYYVRDSDRIAKKTTVYSVDQTGKIYDYIAQMATETEGINSDNYDEVRELISNFNNDYDSNFYSDVYTFKYDLTNKMLELTNETAVKKLEEAISSSGVTEGFKKIKSKKSGIVTYTQDGYENLTADKITQKNFDMNQYTKKQLKTGKLIQKGSPVYKIINNENWSIVIPITKEQKALLAETKSIKVKILKDELQIKADLTILDNKDGIYAKLDFKDYMIRYLSDRFLSIELVLESASGLKIPNTSLVKKTFFKIPIKYLTGGSNKEAANMLNLQTLDKNGEKTVQQIEPEIYKRDDKYCYIAKNDKDKTSKIKTGSILVGTNTDKTYEVSATSVFEGVYCVNKGYATFKPIEKEYSNDDYSIINNSTENGLALYDHIILNSETIEENEKIY